MTEAVRNQLELQEAAAHGVHHQTAYRWVRSGRLPARLVDVERWSEWRPSVRSAALDSERFEHGATDLSTAHGLTMRTRCDRIAQLDEGQP